MLPEPGDKIKAQLKNGIIINAEVIEIVPLSRTLIRIREIGPKSNPTTHYSPTGSSWARNSFVAGDEFIIHLKQVIK